MSRLRASQRPIANSTWCVTTEGDEVGARLVSHLAGLAWTAGTDRPMQASMTDNPGAFKHIFNKRSVTELASSLARVQPDFDEAHFVKRAASGITKLELKARVRQIADALTVVLPQDFLQAADIITASLGPASDTAEEVSSGFHYWPLCHYVETAGLEDYERAFDLMEELTQRFSCEFAIRPYIVRHPKATFARLQRWTRHPNVHVRRLVSEGTRPRLPWGMRLTSLQQNPRPSLKLLDALHEDADEYVRRSVANHLNDISKDHPGLVIDTLRRWQKRGGQHTGALTRHALRGLIKAGNTRALSLVGVKPVELSGFKLRVQPRKVAIGEELQLHISFRLKAAQALIVDYAIHHRRKNGTLSPKVFKWSRLEAMAGQRVELRKAHSFRPVTTRRYYPGKQAVSVLVNGETFGECSFQLVPRLR